LEFFYRQFVECIGVFIFIFLVQSFERNSGFSHGKHSSDHHVHGSQARFSTDYQGNRVSQSKVPADNEESKEFPSYSIAELTGQDIPSENL